jgi:hypothetical protein
MRVSLTEANNIMDTLRPCPPLSEAERIRNIQFERDFQFRYWLANNSWDITIGFILFLSSIFLAATSYLAHLWMIRRKKAQELYDNLQGLGGGTQ